MKRNSQMITTWTLFASMMIVGASQAFARDSGGEDTRVVGAPKTGETALQFIGTVKQTGSNFSMTGYLTAIAGLPEAALFTDPVVRSQATARFTIAATAKLVSRNVLSPMFVLDEAGTATISYSELAGGSAAVLAMGPVTLQTAVQVTSQFTPQSPGKGNFRATGEFQRTATNTFTLGGVMYQLGEPRRAWIITAVGDGTLTDPNTPVSQIVVAGSLVVGPVVPSDH